MNTKNVVRNSSSMYDEISSYSSNCSSDQEGDNSPEKVYNEKSPLVDKTNKTQHISNQSGEPETKNQYQIQYLAALIVTIGGFIAGTSLGWTSPAGPMLENHQYGFTVSKENISWIGALMPLGALLGCPVMAGLVDKLGRKHMLIILTLPTLFGWALIIYAKTVTWIYVGRFFSGFSGGSYSVIIPLYTSEIAEKEIRGTLGSYFQLQVNAGILFTYVLGNYFDLFYLSIACAIVPIVYLCLMTLVHESPIFYLMKGNVDKAKQSLRFFRGPHRNIDEELNTMQNCLAKTERERIPVMKAFQTTSAKRGLFLGLGLMGFQQFTGANAVIFYATTIFNETGSKIGPNESTVVIGIMAVIATYVSTLIIDVLGRKILLLYSVVIMGISTFFIGGFFFLMEYKYDVSSITFIPLVSLCTFIILFSMGFGPVPWMMMGEIFPPQIKGIVSSIVCMSNWFFAFMVTKFFLTLVNAIHIYNTFWLFTMFSVLGTFFVLFIVPETKGKTLEEIQELLGADHTPLLPEYHNQNESNE